MANVEKPPVVKEKTLEERMLEFQERQLRIQEDQVKVQQAQLKQTEAKSKKAPALVSAFNPQGEKDHPMPRLACEVWMPWQQRPADHAFTYEEVELLNQLAGRLERKEPGTFQIELNNGDIETVIVVPVINRVSRKIERMTFSRGWDEDAKTYVALFTHENRQYFPALTNMLRQMLRGQAGLAEAMEGAPEILTMKERLRRTTLPAEDPKHLALSVSE